MPVRSAIIRPAAHAISSVRLRPGRRAAIIAALGSISLGCSTSDPHADYRRVADLVTSATGARPYTPDEDALVEVHVSAMLANGLTVDEAVQVALLNNPSFQSAMAEISASRADLAQSTLLANPMLSLALRFPEGGGLNDLSFGLTQQISQLWQIPIRKQAAEAELERVVLAVGQRAVELVALVRTQCYRVISFEQAAKFAEDNAGLARPSVELTRAQRDAGALSDWEVALATTLAVDVEQDVIDLRVAFFAVQRAEANLRLEARRVFSDVQIGFSLQRDEQRALPGRKILADTALSSVRAGQLTAPDIQTPGQRRSEQSQIIDATLGPTLALTLPIFDQNQAQIGKAKGRVLQARKDYEARAQTVAADIQRSVAGVRMAADLLRLQESQGLPQVELAVRGAQARFAAGEETVLAALSAQGALINRRRSFVAVLRDYAIAAAQLEAAVGGRMPDNAGARAGQPGNQSIGRAATQPTSQPAIMRPAWEPMP